MSARRRLCSIRRHGLWVPAKGMTRALLLRKKSHQQSKSVHMNAQHVILHYKTVENANKSTKAGGKLF